jgi:hypothetical protein
MKNLFKKICFAMTFLWGQTIYCSELRIEDIDVPLDHPLVRKALDEEASFRNATGQHIQDILDITKVIYSASDPVDEDKLRKRINERMETDLKLLEVLYEHIKGLKPGNEVSYPLYFNKMTEAIKGAQPLIHDHLETLLAGNVPLGYQYRSNKITHLAPNDEVIYGDSKGTFLKTALFNIFLQLSQNTDSLDFNKTKLSWVNDSPSYHMTTLPQKMGYDDFLKLDERFRDFPYFLKGDNEWSSGYFCFAHSGYAFGGDRNNPHFPNGKLYGAEDCSSWIAKLTGSPFSFSTVDQLYDYRVYLPEKGTYVPQNWESSPLGSYMKRYEPVAIYNPVRDIKAGQIHAFRVFSDEDPSMETTSGRSGHITLVLGAKNNGDIVTLSYARNMPEYEGFGVKIFPYQTVFPKKVMFFNVQPPRQ